MQQVIQDLLGKDKELPVQGKKNACPELTDVKIRKAVEMVPDDYWNLSSWTFR